MFIALPGSAKVKLNFEGFIADEAHILSDEDKYNLNWTLHDLQKNSKADIAVVTMISLNGRTIEDTALDIGRTYKVGGKGKNNGIVFLTAIEDRRMRIEVGEGLENKISISDLDDIRDYDILPYYKHEDYQNGILRGTYRLAELTAKAEGVRLQSLGIIPPQKSNLLSAKTINDMPRWLLPIAFIFALFSRGRGGSRGSYRSSSSCSFGGGGGFGGFGSSGSW